MKKYMMATKAIHKLGDISRNEENLCLICEEDTENYIGSWVTGLGFFNVKFPKKLHESLLRTKSKNITQRTSRLPSNHQ